MSAMIQDLLAFTKQKEPEPKKEDKAKNNPFNFPEQSRIQTQSSMSNAVNIAEKIRQQKEQEEAKRKAIEKFLPKKQKKINIQEFLRRELDHEQRRQYNIEVMRNKYRDEERKEFQEKPKLTKTTIEISKTLNNPPIYTRTNEDVNRRKASIESLRKMYTQQCECNNKLTTYENSKTDYKKRTKTEYSDDRFNTWLTQQNEWSKKVKKKIMVRSASLAEQKTKALQESKDNHPMITHKSIQILKKSNRKSSYDRLYTRNNDNFNKEVLQMETMPSFAPKINKNKFTYIKPRYYPDLTSHNENTTKIINENRLKRQNKAKSLDRRKQISDEIDIMEVGNRRKTESVEHWSTSLMKMGKNKSNVNYVPTEVLYKLNIMHAAAWNENDVNNIPLQGESKNIIGAFL